MRLSMVLLGLIACKTDPQEVIPTDGPTPVPTATDLPSTTADTGDTDAHTGPTIPEVDCTVPPSGPFSGRVLNTPRAYHGLAFDGLGNMASGDGSNLILSTDTDSTTLLVPNLNGTQQMNYLPNGDLAVVVGGQIVSVTPSGIRTTLASGIGAYGLDVGPDGMIYTANQSVVHRVDPAGVQGAQVIIPNGAVGTPKVTTFNLEGTELYVGTNFSQGAVHRFDIDAHGDPILPGQQIANTGGSWHDGMGMDACGRLYLAEYNTRSLYMIEPGTGSIQLLNYYDTPLGGSAYGHGLEWGGGVGVWDDHKLYVPLPYNNNRVAEIDLGVPSKDFNGGVYTTVH